MRDPFHPDLVYNFKSFAGTCDKLPEYFDSSLSVTETFPVATGTVLDVTLSCTDNKLAVGDKTITCFGGNHFFYSETPACLPQGTSLMNRQNDLFLDEKSVLFMSYDSSSQA